MLDVGRSGGEGELVEGDVAFGVVAVLAQGQGGGGGFVETCADVRGDVVLLREVSSGTFCSPRTSTARTNQAVRLVAGLSLDTARSPAKDVVERLVYMAGASQHDEYYRGVVDVMSRTDHPRPAGVAGDRGDTSSPTSPNQDWPGGSSTSGTGDYISVHF